MKALETERLRLRRFGEDDFAAVHSYAGCEENIIYMPWGPNDEALTRSFINTAIAKAEEIPCNDYHFAIVLKETGGLIGGCSISPEGDTATLGWCLHRDHWKRGYGTETARALLKFGFEELRLRRITAACDAENTGSCRVMESAGMRREGLFIEARPPHKRSDKSFGDTLSYAILREEWDTLAEIAYYNALPVEFTEHIDASVLTDGAIYLMNIAKSPANPEKKWVPQYIFAICLDGEEPGNMTQVGTIALRIGYTDGLYYGGNIGYEIYENHRGNGYAGRACRLVLSVAKAHGMKKLLITNNITNDASRRVCEKLGARLLRVARIPEWCDLYRDGGRFSNIFEVEVQSEKGVFLF